MHATHRNSVVIAAALAIILIVPSVGGAAPGPEPRGGGVSCRARATKLGDEITVTFWLRTGRADRRWLIRIWDNDELLIVRARITNAAGNIRVRVGAENLPHRDVFRFRATTRGGASCRVDDLRV